MLRAPQNFFPRFLVDGGGISPDSLHPRLLHRKSAGNAGLSGCARSRSSKWRLSVRAGYRRIPLETPGAYQLVNDDTGEKFIVWGGTEGLDSPIPSEEVLSWKPDQHGSRKEGPKNEFFDATGAEATATVAEEGSPPMARVGASVKNFGRLKAHYIRGLIKKSSKVTKENSRNKKESIVGDASVNEAKHIDPVEFLREHSSSVLLKHKELHNTMITDKQIQGTTSLDIIPKQDLRPESTRPSVPKVASSLEGRSGAGSAKSTTAGRLKQHKKVTSDSGFFSRKSFKEIGCSDDVIESLKSQMFLRPSHIQAMAYGPVLEGKSCIIADQSGSGKTLAYLAPIIQCLRQEELLGLGKSLPRSPRVIILVPTAELASQVLHKCRSIAKFGVPFRSMVTTGGFRQKTQLDNLQQELDVLIATPGRFVFLLQEGYLQLANLKCAVLDEVDILYGDEGFEQVLQSLISSAPMATQYLFVTATLPVDIYNKLVEVFPDCEVTMGPGMHRTSSGLEEILVECNGDPGEEKNPDTAFLNKKTSLLQLVEESPVPKTVIFCNKIETCRKVENVLKRFDRREFCVRALPFHAAVAQEIRLSNMKEFHNSQSLKDSMFLICTDRASRGIDFVGVDHVILFDFPRDPSEYVRRVGRTARGAGGTGKAFVFAVGKQVSLARRIMERSMKGHPLHDVPSAYEHERLVL